MALPKGTLLKDDRYQVEKLLARGGFGFIYLTRDRLTGQWVVLKELIPMLVDHAEVVRRFVREGRTMQRLSHPNIVRTDAVFRDRGNYYTVMEYLSGGSLTNRLEQVHKLSLTRAVMVTVALSDALAYLHERGITHCDLNPSNVIFDQAGVPKLLDLGIAHVSDAFVHRSWRTERNLAMGTVMYMAPEQIDGVRDDPRIDLYALGAILYQMLSGKLYLDFDVKSTPGAQADNVHLVRDQVPVPIAEVPPEVNRVLLRALAKRPGKRYANATAFRQALIQAVLPYVSPRAGLYMIAPFPESDRQLTAFKPSEWPGWVWWTLSALNLAAMFAAAMLVLGFL